MFKYLKNNKKVTAGIFLVIATLVIFTGNDAFYYYRQKGLFSNIFPNFTTMCLGRFLLPDDQIDTINKILYHDRNANCLSFSFKQDSLGQVLMNSSRSNELGTLYSLYPLKNMTYLSLVKISLGTNDIEPLKYLTNVKALGIEYKGVEDLNLKPLQQLKNLKILALGSPRNIDLSPISNSDLEVIAIITHNNSYALSTIQRVESIKTIFIESKAFSKPFDLNLLSRFPNLEEINIKDIKMTNIELISNAQSLKSITLTINPKTDLTPLLKLQKLDFVQIFLMKGAKCPKFPKKVFCIS